MEQSVRNKLRNVVTQCRKLLEEATAETLQGHFGIYATGKKGLVTIDDETSMSNLSEEDLSCRHDLIDHLKHIEALGYKPKDALEQLVREISFTHLNRLCAYKMMEARGLIREAVSRGLKSQGFMFYLADHPEDEKLHNGGKQDEAYRHYLDWLGGTLSEEIGVLFNPNDPANRIYPPQRVMDDVLGLINDVELNGIWSQDETIGWVYQYFTPRELRDKARKKSQAPRNSYELAFRNQFFTPRYVVEFLTDNTLGRVWYEMRKGETALSDKCKYLVRRPKEVFLAKGAKAPDDAKETKEDLSQEEFLNRSVYIPHRSKKDPREIRILDPASGSGHFLLYCFDLLKVIYEEAWTDMELPSPTRIPGPDGRSHAKKLRDDYSTIEDLRKAVPGLILRHNLHGIDIDLRATQIAALALWLRCQRAFQELDLENSQRPKITRSNIVCAEPMPGEEDMLKEFTSELRPKVLGQLLEVVFDKMKLAGEVGSLLNIEQEIRQSIANAKTQWQSAPRIEQEELFAELKKPKVEQGRFFDVSDVTEEHFWEQAEDSILRSLEDFSRKKQNGKALQRRLFSDDASSGFSFVDICQKKYDAVLMNPPFGLGLKGNFKWLKETYPDGFVDLLSAFISRAATLSCGFVGAITSRSILMTKKLERLRKTIVIPRISTILDLGWAVMDGATVQSCAYTISDTDPLDNYFVAIDRKQSEDKTSPTQCSSLEKERGYLANRKSILLLPRSQLLYSLPPKLLRLLRSKSRLRSTVLEAKHGMNTFNNFRFLRLRWEVPVKRIGEGLEWEPLSKGGPYAVYYLDLPLLVRWNGTGDEIAEENKRANGQTAQARQASTYYRLPGATYSRRSSKDFGVRMLPAGCIIGEKGPAVLATGEYSKEFIVALLNSRLINFLVHIQANAKQYDSGILERLPWIQPKPEVVATLEELTRKCIRDTMSIAGIDETDSHFSGVVYSQSLMETVRGWNDAIIESQKRLDHSQATIDELIDVLYGVDSKDLRENLLDAPSEVDNESDVSGKREEDDALDIDPLTVSDVAQITISICVGSILGRWDISHFNEQSESDAYVLFAPIPQIPPAARFVSGEGNLRGILTSDGILVDDVSHKNDVIRRVRDVIEVLWHGQSEDIEREACDSLNVAELRDYVRKPGNGGFWMDHVKRYSKSRRKAPIYWYLRSSKGNYGLWLYYHRLDKDILFKALLNYVEPKMRLEEDRLTTLRSRKETAGSAGREAKQLEKDVDRQEQFISELRDFVDKLRRVAELHLDPDLNDGVVLNIAPLHELVPWKEAKKYWDELMDGKYEWSTIGKQLREKGVMK